MAWLEAVFMKEGSSKEEGNWWFSDVLLDRNVPNPAPSMHPLRAQLSRLGESGPRGSFPSLAVAGISCRCINKIETPDTLEVLSLYRYHIQSLGPLSVMPPMGRKC